MKPLGSFPSQQTHGFILAPIACDMVAPSTVKTIEPLSKAAKVSVFFSSGRSREDFTNRRALCVTSFLKKRGSWAPF